MKLFAPLDERVGNLLCFRIPLADDVVHVREDGMRCAIVLQVAEIHGAVRKEEVWRAELNRVPTNGVIEMKSYGCHPR